ncbi:protein translocase subunit secA [Anaerobacterium chartisolvens]|uniref:Protein translocase subunit SecA n=1 Tax=Anaerobacterium chartisolvens TaxID=1297424 RepID=A0A369B8H1_9FIRM|nr:accessory Sec system translocase SecA2 [Anaerobacterium chartisolvens]RCX16837.1 protein translocase subunit secA [Anaerobacterium chartisolvens]
MLKKMNMDKLALNAHGINYSDYDIIDYRELLEDIKRTNLKSESDSSLKKISAEILNQARDWATHLDDLLPRAYALVFETAKRVLGLTAFDVQIIAGAAMHHGKLVELQTGEGKTLAAVFPAYLNALTGRGVHVLTANDYLARRDAGWMGPVYTFLGLTTGFINEGMAKEARRKAYACDITYITAKEAGFDYLRDCLCYEVNELVQREFNFAIVDEADSILIDESRIPLIISENVPVAQGTREEITNIVGMLEAGVDYDTDEASRNVYLTDQGTNRVEKLLGCGNIYAEENYELLIELNCALHAGTLLRRDVDYIVQDGRVELVDELTGRVADKRVWPDGLQAAIESKEGITSFSKGRILGTITVQHFMENYRRICGMTATAKTSEGEFKEFYNLDVVAIPPNRPCIRIDYQDAVFTHLQAKYEALTAEIKRTHATGRPILVGTASIEESEKLADTLQKAGIKCNVLNAKNDELEAGIIAQAGTLGAVTVSTNMAGRGTDIRLGGDLEKEREKVVGLGGLYVIATNKYESRRIDDQLRGRAGRQGDPGSSRFFVSLEDDLFKKYGNSTLISSMRRMKKQEGPIDNPIYLRSTEKVQKVAEGQNASIRGFLWRYSYIIEEQRKIIYKRRRDILFGRVGIYLLEEMAPEQYRLALKYVDASALKKVEKYIFLYHIDQCWAEYLARVNCIREGIHLVNIGGMNPLEEYNRIVIEEYRNLNQMIDDEAINAFNQMDFSGGRVDLSGAGIKAPASTWTYQVTDNPFSDDLGMLLANSRNIGLAGIGMILMWPVLLFGLIYNRFRKNKHIK